MTVFDDAVNQVARALGSYQGASGTYVILLTGASSSITLLRTRDVGVSGQDAPDQGTRMFDVLEAEVAAPAAGDTIADSDGTWTVRTDGIAHRPGNVWRLTCGRAHLQPFTGSGVV